MPVILFDIDETLLDLEVWRACRNPLLESLLGVSRHALRELQKSYVSELYQTTPFTPEGFGAYIENLYKIRKEKVIKTYYDKVLLAKAVFPDVFPALNQLRQSHTLGIYSTGDRNYQINKLKGMGIYPYFDPELLFINEQKTHSWYVSALPNSFIIDDDIITIEELKKARHITPFLLDRTRTNKTLKVNRIHTLLEIPKLVA